jgi:hypothetical protein
VVFALTLVLALTGISAPVLIAQPACSIGLRFQPLREAIPELVGNCLEAERVDAVNGDVQQRTTGGLLLWSRASGLAAFTNGATTWLLGPDGLVSRPNDAPPFPFETVATVAPPPIAGPAVADPRRLVLTAADLTAEGNEPFVHSDGNSGYEEPADGSVRAWTTSFGQGPTPFAPGIFFGVVIRYSDPAAAETGLRSLSGTTFLLDGLTQFSKPEDWSEVNAPGVGERSRAFRSKVQPTLYKLRDGSIHLDRLSAGWLFSQRGLFVYGVGIHAVDDRVSNDALWPRARLVDERVQQALADPARFAAADTHERPDSDGPGEEL